MINKENLNYGFWKAICAHYEKECYTDVVKDACLYIIEIVQERADLENLDGMELINKAFSESNPKVLINNNQTESEKNEQKGFALILRGIISAMRNPISHTSSFTFSKEETESIVLFINNYILPRLLESKDCTYVEDWFDFIFNRNDNDSERFSDVILKEMTKKAKNYLMVQLVNKIDEIRENKYEYIIKKLYNSLTLKEKREIVLQLNRKLINEDDGLYLRMFFNHFEPTMWKELDELVKLRIEDLVYTSIKSGKLYVDVRTMQKKYSGLLGIYAIQWINEFENKKEIIKLLYKKLENDKEDEYVYNHFVNIMSDRLVLKEYSKNIIDGLKSGNVVYKVLLDDLMYTKDTNDKLYNLFVEHYQNLEAILEELPF